jgi:hypothetical protein
MTPFGHQAAFNSMLGMGREMWYFTRLFSVVNLCSKECTAIVPHTQRWRELVVSVSVLGVVQVCQLLVPLLSPVSRVRITLPKEDRHAIVGILLPCSSWLSALSLSKVCSRASSSN